MAMSPRLLRPVASGFDPRSLGSLAYWLDASDASTITTVSGAVSEWRSKAGTGLAATQSTAANRPAYTMAGQNGRNVVTFDGVEGSAGDSLVTSTLSISQPFTVVWAGRSNGRAAGVSPADGPYIFDGSTSGTRVVIGWNSTGTIANNGRLLLFSGGATTVEAASGTQAYNEWSVVTSVFNGSSSSLRANGAAVATGTLGATGITALRLGTRFDQAATSAATFFEGPWGAFLVYSKVLSADEIARVERYLARLWGVTLA